MRPGLFSNFCEPILHNSDAARVYRGEADSHARPLACIDDRSLGSEVRPVVRYLDSDLSSVNKRRHRLNKAPEQIQVLCVRGDLFSGVESGQMNSGDERKALSAMPPERDGSTSVVLTILRETVRRAGINDECLFVLVNRGIAPSLAGEVIAESD